MSDETLLGTFTDASGEGFEVLAKGRLVMLRGDQCSTVLLGPEARDELRELLDRAAMPGQRRADGEAPAGAHMIDLISQTIGSGRLGWNAPEPGHLSTEIGASVRSARGICPLRSLSSQCLTGMTHSRAPFTEGV